MLNLFLSKTETMQTRHCDSSATPSGLASPTSDLCSLTRDQIRDQMEQHKHRTMEDGEPAGTSLLLSPVDSLSCALKSPGELKHYPLDRKLWRRDSALATL